MHDMPVNVVFPACAGMNRRLASGVVVVDGVPRVCGDEPQFQAAVVRYAQCSPRVRG